MIHKYIALNWKNWEFETSITVELASHPDLSWDQDHRLAKNQKLWMGVWLQAGKEPLQCFFIIVKPWGVSDLPYIFAELGIELLAKKKMDISSNNRHSSINCLPSIIAPFRQKYLKHLITWNFHEMFISRFWCAQYFVTLKFHDFTKILYFELL